MQCFPIRKINENTSCTCHPLCSPGGGAWVTTLSMGVALRFRIASAKRFFFAWILGGPSRAWEIETLDRGIRKWSRTRGLAESHCQTKAYFTFILQHVRDSQPEKVDAVHISNVSGSELKKKHIYIVQIAICTYHPMCNLYCPYHPPKNWDPDSASLALASSKRCIACVGSPIAGTAANAEAAGSPADIVAWQGLHRTYM